eukprot:CAMPEP_0196722832 /NCGR_PEP_ID=MMETSP1091-20130531/5055_1 /TAXON_ID=302021 /ORGANISM="Rhodomonas sp., Strain CCMP768" /LENGTH=445 /DNA_ID=CAMNT_0042064611 /DNA_START=24 /DNA_END=1361 /DNA_ORIENTATION=+
MMRTATLFGVLFTMMPFVVHCEEEAALGDVVGDSGVGMAGYIPPSNVVEHSKIDLDIRDIENKGSNYAVAKVIYEDGLNSRSGDGFRTLQSFSTKYANVDNNAYKQEPFAKLAHEYWGEWDYSNQHILAALEPLDSTKYGDYKTGKWASTDAVRTQIVKKVIKFQLVWLYALHELESAYAKYTDTKRTDEERYGANGAVHAFDEWWAFYVGSLEDGSVESGETDGDGKGYGPYIAAEKFAEPFGTEGYVVSNGGKSYVNWELMFQAHAAQRLLQKAGNEEELADVFKCIRAMMKVPLIQGCIRYAYVTTTKEGTDEFAKYKGEMWAFCSAALPFLHEADADAAATVRAETEVSNTASPDFDKIKEAFNGETVNKMGLRCSDIGHLNKKDYKDADHKECNDVDLSNENAYADAKICPKIKMPNSGTALRGSWFLSFALVAVAWVMH